MEDFEKMYKKKTPKSSKLFEKSKRQHVNGVSHNIRFFKPYPFVTNSAKGKFLIDVDSNKYVDYWMGHWSLILGHAPKQISDAAKDQLKKSWMYGVVNKNTVDLSDLISKSVPAAQKIRYVTSGTEADMYAIRLARAATAKKMIAKIDGGWHGYTSDLLKTVNWPFEQSESKGLNNEEHIVSLPYNDLEKSIEVLKSTKGNLAGIIVEPVLGGGGCIPATKDYLHGLQEYTRSESAMFILDEIVTGFRFRYGCIYETMGLDPDIITLGKIVGGGFPIGVICGKDEIMNLANTQLHSKTDRAYIGGGTFSANPMSMAGGTAMLQTLKTGRAIYEKINGLGDTTRKKLDKTFDGKVITTGRGSLFMTHFVRDGITEIQNSADVSRCDSGLLHQYHFEMIAKDGIFFLPGKLGAFSNAHSNSDVVDLVSASEKFAQRINR